MATRHPQRSLLSEAIRFGWNEVVLEHLNAGEDPNSEDAPGRSLLLISLLCGRGDITRMLLDHGASIRLPDAAGLQNVELLETLLANGSSANATNGAGMTPLMVACAVGDVRAISILTRHGVHIRVADRTGFTALDWAVLHRHSAAARTLLADLPAQTRGALLNDLGSVPIAISRSDTAIITTLLDCGMSPNGRDDTGKTYLCEAAVLGKVPIVELLLQTGADPNLPDVQYRFTPLMWAASAGNAETVRFLLEQGADPMLADSRGRTARAIAASAGHTDLAVLLE